jgi:spore coat protein U-like protein
MRTYTKLAALAAVVAALVSAPGSVSAATSTGQFTVSATVAPSCIISGTNLVFGAYDPTAAAALTGSSTIQVTCTRGTGYSVNLSSAHAWTMTNAANPALSYQLFSNAGRTAVWDSAVANAVTGTAPTPRAPVALTVYGSIPPNQDVVPGTAAAPLSYTDTVTATVTF